MLAGELEQGKRLYLLTDKRPVGMVSVCGSLIEHLYVLPGEQGKGYGTALLRFAVGQCESVPALWCLSSNRLAIDWYLRLGFAPTGRRNNLTGTLWELELQGTKKVAESLAPWGGLCYNTPQKGAEVPASGKQVDKE